MYNIAVILAGGIGARVGGNMPKQLLPLADGKTILEHSVDAFEQAECIDEVCIVMHPDYICEAEKMLQVNDWQKVKHIVAGGKERWESSVNAIRLYQERLESEQFAEANILLHDAARPFVSQRIINDVCKALEEHEAVVVAIPSTDTVYEMQNGCVARIPNRSTIMRAQTPQAFRLSLIAEAYDIALNSENMQVTDDCGVVFNHIPTQLIQIVLGEEQNRKITFKEDILC
ncbi:MAG: 2-C-methyl-D-erythritol 4-phosphate cytidylyltransferase [Paludibacteraceae bacterium]|nr:2-C-methyl-D-erythritol 4-phosphate cytidylyltransferase [Paludibacteraceae bacterium]